MGHSLCFKRALTWFCSVKITVIQLSYIDVRSAKILLMQALLLFRCGGNVWWCVCLPYLILGPSAPWRDERGCEGTVSSIWQDIGEYQQERPWDTSYSAIGSASLGIVLCMSPFVVNKFCILKYMCTWNGTHVFLRQKNSNWFILSGIRQKLKLLCHHMMLVLKVNLICQGCHKYDKTLICELVLVLRQLSILKDEMLVCKYLFVNFLIIDCHTFCAHAFDNLAWTLSPTNTVCKTVDK